MILDQLVQFNPTGAKDDLSEWLSSTQYSEELQCVIATQEMAGKDTIFADIYLKNSVTPYHGFGGLYIRIWAMGDPLHLIYGLYLGSKVSKSQTEIRRGVAYTRSRLQNVIEDLENPNDLNFKYRTWTDSQAEWLGKDSKRAAVRQLDLFVTFKEVICDQSIDFISIKSDIERLINAMRASAEVLKPLNEFAKDVVAKFFLDDEQTQGENNVQLQTGYGSDELEVIPSVINVDWTRIQSITDSPCGLVSLKRQFQQSVGALKAGKHVVLLGPPGTGKTELALCLCRLLELSYDLTTATSDWTTFDTIGGYMPAPDSNQGNGINELNFSPGVVMQALMRNRWLIIDELNRADIDKAFGELFTVLSGENKRVRLPFKKYHDDKFRDIVLGRPEPEENDAYAVPIPENWRIIGTMNTFDKASLYQLSFAFLRRFAFIEIPVPDVDSYKQIIERAFHGTESGEISPLAVAFSPMLQSIFTPDPGTGLERLNLLVGPAIPLDIVRYLKAKYSEGDLTNDSVAHKTAFIEALAMYLYPQFEGKDRQHLEIDEVIKESLQLPYDLQVKSDQSLRVWTGYEAEQ